MTKRFIIICSIIIVLIIAIVSSIIAVCVSNRDIYTEDDDTVVLIPDTLERLYEVLASKDAKLKIIFSNIDTYSGISIKDYNNRESLIIDGNNYYFEELTIETNAKNVIISNISIKNDCSTILVMNGAYTTLKLESCLFDVENTACAANILSDKCIITLVSTSKFYGGDADTAQNGASALLANDITINTEEESMGILCLYGGIAGVGVNGTNGSDGYSYNPSTQYTSWSSGRDGASGGNGENASEAIAAGQGGDALVCQELTVYNNAVLKCYGGDGAKSGAGANGGDGGSGEGAVTPNPIRWRSYSGGCGGNSGNGSNGADEVRPGVGIKATTVNIYSTTNVISVRGKRGEPGVGGKAGLPGTGGWGSESSVTHSGGPKQASSGAYGIDGNKGKILDESEIFDYIINTISGFIGTE